MVSTHARASSGTVVWKGTDSWLCQLTRSCGALDPTRPRQQAQVVQGNNGGDRNADSAERVTKFNWSPSMGPPDLQEEPVAYRTRGGGTGRSDDGDGEAKMEDGLYPLRKVPMANPEQRPIGDIELDDKFRLNDLVLIPEADNNLLGRDLIIALGIKITPCKGNFKIYSLTEEDNFEISNTVWYTGEAGKLNVQPISVEIQNPEIPIRVKQYPISLEGRKGLKLVVENSVHQGVLESCVSPHNTPILPVKKPDGSYRLVQDLRAVNQRTITRIPGVSRSAHTSEGRDGSFNDL
ncbi:hypothetical protein DUI87_27377 [Hirundo rustica rustica]|uniref:Uncharacterized protein n=1 Tax=Hirundo rustica rustica TaxID=333673 RepID=A0A3M0J3X2_HIRRU|nr:hypothetical protein DUI87_27377 [Hirundo rustica rustica]